MKKALIALLVLVALGCGIYVGYEMYTKAPENAIIGTWNNDELEGAYYEFNEDGTMSGKVTVLSVTTGINGTYTLDKDTKTLSISYQLKSPLLSLETKYDLQKTFEFTKDGKLILTDENGDATTFTKAENNN
ncbi:MAG TPA: hypothetical protein DDY98_06455 [Ruminococcaceae bacterium]|nr:hypothetical protein [Oscillospiraceae bacterium]